jgi:hypothetical protein
MLEIEDREEVVFQVGFAVDLDSNYDDIDRWATKSPQENLKVIIDGPPDKKIVRDGKPSFNDFPRDRESMRKWGEWKEELKKTIQDEPDQTAELLGRHIGGRNSKYTLKRKRKSKRKTKGKKRKNIMRRKSNKSKKKKRRNRFF